MSSRRHRSPSSPKSSRSLPALLPVLLIALTACGGGPKPKTAAPTLPQTPPSQPGETSSGPAPTPRPPQPKPKPETLIVIDDPAAQRKPLTLAEAAERARKQRQEAGEPKVSITNDNLSEYATGQVTMMEGETAAPGETETDSLEELARDEQHWRQGARDLRLRLRRAVDERGELEQQVAGLRLRFYAEDDPYVRDSQIKPAWDRLLERQRQVELEVKAYRRELEEFLEEGRRAGALPGWLREGLEYEPELEPGEGADSPESTDEDIGGLPRHHPTDPESTSAEETPRQEPP